MAAANENAPEVILGKTSSYAIQGARCDNETTTKPLSRTVFSQFTCHPFCSYFYTHIPSLLLTATLKPNEVIRTIQKDLFK